MTKALTQYSEGLAEIVENTGRSVVRVEGRRRLPATGIIWSEDGLILTAHHVVHHEEHLQIGLPNGESASAQLVGRDPSTDLAVLRVDVKGLTPAIWGDSESLKTGNVVLALGRPGAQVSATLGVVSAVGASWNMPPHGEAGERGGWRMGRGFPRRGWRTPLGGSVDLYLQTDVVMYPGFSGGPLVGMDGKIVGLNTSGFSRGVSLTIPTSTIKRVLESLLKHGHIRRGYLGVGTQPVPLNAAQAKEVGQETGLLIVSVEADSPAEKGGLLLGDIVLGLAGERVTQIEDLLAVLGGDVAGTTVPVKIIRGGQLMEVSVMVGERQ